MGTFSLFEHRLELLHFAGEMPAAPAGDAARIPLQDRCVLALADATPQGTNAAWRAGLLARDRGAPLHLLGVAGHAGGLAAAEAAVQDLARQLQQRLNVATTATTASSPGSLREHLAAFSGRAGLLVLPWRRGNLLADAVLGAWPQRMQRVLSIPMLVVRRPALGSYRRVLVPVKLDAAAVSTIAAARSVSRDPRMRVIHVLDTGCEGKLRLADSPERALRLHRQGCTRAATAALGELIARAGAQADGATALVSFGHVPARVLDVARAGNAQLLVVGKQRRPALAQAFFADVTGCLLSGTGSDVLVLPLDGGGRSGEEALR